MSTSLVTSALRDAPPDWDDFVRARGSFYHRAPWVSGLAAQFGYDAHFLMARADGRLVGVLPLLGVPGLLGGRRLSSLPFSYAAGPLALDADADAALCAAARELARRTGARALELKRRGIAVPAAEGFVRSSRYVAWVVPTEGGADSVWRRLHASHVQRGIRKGQKTVTVERGHDAAAWARMADLQQHTSRRLGLPAPPDAFFTHLCAALQEQGLTDVLLARVPDGSYAAGIVMWKGTGEHIYAFGASLPEFWEHRPNHVLLWTAAQDAAAAGVPFDLGRAAPEQEGLTQFKQRWGGEPHPLAYDYSPAPKGLNTMPRDRGLLAAGGRLWSSLPLSVTRRASFLYRYLG